MKISPSLFFFFFFFSPLLSVWLKIQENFFSLIVFVYFKINVVLIGELYSVWYWKCNRFLEWFKTIHLMRD